MTGYIHSTESFGSVDGPGVRFVIFMQGCPMRCAFCHNPDTWEIGKGTEVNADELLASFNKNREFYQNGGITVSGGEPLLQAEFLTELFKKAKADNILTCLDTSGIVYSEKDASSVTEIDALLDFCDLVMLDIKQIDPDKHKKLTGFSNDNVLDFARHLDDKGISVWIRTVVVPGVNDAEEDLVNLGRFIGRLKNVKALDVLPYHKMGVDKYEKLGIDYQLSGVPAADKEDAIRAKSLILSGIKDVRG